MDLSSGSASPFSRAFLFPFLAGEGDVPRLPRLPAVAVRAPRRRQRHQHVQRRVLHQGAQEQVRVWSIKGE